MHQALLIFPPAVGKSGRIILLIVKKYDIVTVSGRLLLQRAVLAGIGRMPETVRGIGALCLWAQI